MSLSYERLKGQELAIFKYIAPSVWAEFTQCIIMHIMYMHVAPIFFLSTDQYCLGRDGFCIIIDSLILTKHYLETKCI